jgi:hypothetical protein
MREGVNPPCEILGTHHMDWVSASKANMLSSGKRIPLG